MPYSTSCGAKTRSIRVPTSIASEPSTIADTIGPANTPTAIASGVSTVTAHVSSADDVRSTVAVSRRLTAPDSSGTTTLASAPPATISKTMFGSVLTV